MGWRRRRPRKSIALVVAVAASSHFALADDWRFTNLRPVQGRHWRVAEVEFYADARCSKRIDIVKDSAYIAPLPGQLVWKSPLLRATEDCWSHCKGKAGRCDWCGAGNACAGRASIPTRRSVGRHLAS